MSKFKSISTLIVVLCIVATQVFSREINAAVKDVEANAIVLDPTDELPSVLVDDFLMDGDADYVSDSDFGTITDEEAEDQDEAFEETLAADSILDNDKMSIAQNQTEDEGRDILDTRIINGQSVSISHFPWQVSFQREERHICGGTIVAPTIIITAAHCIEKPGALSSYRVRVGSSYHDRGGLVVGVRKLIRQENYVPKVLDSDIAIVVLAQRLNFNKNVRPIRVATQGDPVPARRRLFISGWGYTSQGAASLPSTLQYVAVRLLDEDACQKSYRAVTRITNRMFCAGAAHGGKDSCQGDSGGPLVSYVNGSPKLYGVVSWGVGCAQKGFPGVYTKVSSMRPWINKQIAQLRKRND